MSAILLDGRALAKRIETEIGLRAAAFASKHGRSIGLGLILVGNSAESRKYIESKEKRAKAANISVQSIVLADDVSEQVVRDEINLLNKRPEIDAILLQLPLPKQLDADTLLFAIDPRKDVDGLHPLNQGLLARREGGGVTPCTPRACLGLVQEARRALSGSDSLEGLTAVVIGRSALVGHPVFELLQREHVTVTLCHSKTKELSGFTKQADIVVSAAGRPGLISAEMINEGAIVIDVGLSFDSQGKMVGDTLFDELVPKAGALTPVPGGVGPLTISMLLLNTLELAEARVS